MVWRALSLAACAIVALLGLFTIGSVDARELIGGLAVALGLYVASTFGP